jgi:iron-sulfur cluster assembly accessory protein
MATDITSRQESVVSLTRSAADHIRSMQSEQAENAGKALRVYVEGGGCSGLQYGMVFDEQRDGDLACESFGVPVLVDATSAEYVRGAVIDYSDALTGGGFKIQNPKARSSCGCGKSFEA